MLLAAALRLAHLDAGWFGVDQARDVRWAELIARGEAYPWLGPLMRNRFHLGALYYYFWSLPAFLATSPLALYVYAGVLGTLAVVLVWLATRALCGVPAALAAAALLATSPVAVIDARIAWAPAALQPWSALLLLVAIAFLARPSSARAVVLLFVAALGTQLHVAAAPLTVLAGLVVLGHVRRLSPRGLVLALLAGSVPLVPMLAGLGEPVPAVAAAVPTLADPRSHRIADLLLLSPRVLTGLAAPAQPLLLRAWLLVESAAMAATLAAALYVLLRPPRAERAAAARLVALLLLAGVGAVVLLPAETWYYYLDATLVPGAVVLGGAWAALRGRRAAVGLLCVVVLARTLVLTWWIHAAAAAGYVATNLDFLRLGGARPAAPDARARVLDVATRTGAGDVLARELAIPLERLWRDVHGAGFADLDTDNGYFLRRAALAAHDGGTAASATAPSAGSAVVFYRGDFPDSWLARLEPARHVGPLEIHGYAAAIDLASAVVLGCDGSAPMPVQAPPAPLDYGSGEPSRPRWPCAEPRVELDVRAPADDVALRVFARIDGAGRVLDVRAEPPGAPIAAAAPGAGVGLELAPGPARVTVRLAVDGPARLDLYELHGLR